MKFTSGNFLYLLTIAFSLTGLSFTNVQVASSNKEFDEIIDAWHHAAATGDSVGFFSRMTEDALYLGTDETERWTRTTMGKDLGKFFNGKRLGILLLTTEFIPHLMIKIPSFLMKV